MRNVDSFARQAAAQYGLLTTRQLRDHVRSDHEITRLLQSGVLHRQRRGVYRLVGSPLSWHSDLMAACLASPLRIVASHRSANRLWGLRTVDDQVEVSVRYPRRLEIPGVIVHRIRDLTEHDFTYIEGIPVTTPARTLCDAGLVFGDKEVQRMINHALAKRIVTSRDLWRFRLRVGRQGRTGVGALERALDRLPPDVHRADSGPEIEMRQLCEDFALPIPIWQHPVVARGVTYRIDFAYPDKRVAIEYDEFDAHTTPEAFVNDRRRQNNLQECGWTVFRFTWDDLRDDPAGVADRLRRIRKSVNGSSRNS